MAQDGLAELILRPALELALHIAGYLTGYVVVPIFMLRHVVFEPDRKGTKLSSGGRITRRVGGNFVIEAEMRSFCELAFWALFAFGV